MSQSGFLRWLSSLAVYREPRVIAILFLGFSSGLPLALTFGTLTLWLAESGIDKTSIGLFALAGIPYTFKFLWAPILDRASIPWLTALFGRRRSWILLTQFALALSILALGFSNPTVNPLQMGLFALLTAFFSASQDIVIDAYRVEILEERQYGAGAAMVVLGYRLGMLISGAGALYLATFLGWFYTYVIMATAMSVGIVTILLNPEPTQKDSAESLKQEAKINKYLEASPWLQGWKKNVVARFWGAVIAPFSEFMTRRGWLLTLLFILLYKFGDALAGVMSNPFYVELGFSKIEIANVSKLFGLAALIVGSFIGGALVNRIGIMKALLWCGLLQMFSNLMFVWLAHTGYNMTVLTMTIAIENLSSGMGMAAFVSYLSILCNVAYTATQYALLSSLMAFGRTLLSSSGGWFADHMSWGPFFLLTTAAALPGMLLLVWMIRKFPINNDIKSTPIK
ncbi:MAG: AmpG family muropeptide MFS transporter [Magnetococcales bacterium]|nr:AmpG family muropeptide MFS transporter [Magnetococcales bacterium]